MPNRLKVAILAAVFFGFIAAYGVYNFLRQQQEAANKARTETVNIIVANQDMPPGTVITKEMVQLTAWPKVSVPARSFSSPEQVVGKISKARTVAGEPILESKLTGEGAGLTVLLTPGNRAMAVRVDEIIGVSGFIAPNDRVDLIAHVQPPGSQGDNKISKIVLQNKKVLSVAQSVEQKEGGKPQIARSITLEVTPEEAERLTIAELQGEIFLALRAVGDENVVQTRGSTKADLLSLASAPANPGKAVRPTLPPEEKKFVVEVYSGSAKSVKQF